jgi:carbon storage regulator
MDAACGLRRALTQIFAPLSSAPNRTCGESLLLLAAFEILLTAGGGCCVLILTRRKSERVKVGEEITITVLDITGAQVRIGIDAPREIEVHREEIYERIQRERGHPME